MIKTYDIEIDCALCANKSENAIKCIEGINDCKINFITQKMILDFDGLEEEVIKNIKKSLRRVAPDFVIKRYGK